MNKRIFVKSLMITLAFSVFASGKKDSKTQKATYVFMTTVQVVIPTLENIVGTEQIWLGGQIRDKLKSNLQDYLCMQTVVDSKSEEELKRLQRESESEGRNEENAIELGKITTAKFALFSIIRKTNSGYIISADYTDLTTGEQKASVTSKEYTKIEYLYGNTGAVDEITLALADKLGIKISDIYRKALINGTADFTVEAQLALVEQNEANYKRLMNQFEKQINLLSLSNDLNAENEKRKIEAEKILIEEKQKTDKKRETELKEQKAKADSDAKKEEERSIEFITKRDELAKLAEDKATKIRKLQYERQGVFGEINALESKKKVLVEIRQSVEQQCLDLYKQYQNDKNSEIEKIKNKSFSTVELENGVPTEAAKKRRDNQIIAVNENSYNKFMEDSKSIKRSTLAQENALLAEIRSDQKSLAKDRNVSSLDGELKISYGSYSGQNNGWNTFISLYSEGILLYEDSFILKYESLTGKKAPNVATELNDSIINEYTNNVEMYNSLFARSTPLLCFELDYNVVAENDDKPSEYVFNFNTIRVINIINTKNLQTTNLNKKNLEIMNFRNDLREIAGIVEDSKIEFTLFKKYVGKGIQADKAISMVAENKELYKKYKDFFVVIPEKNIVMLKTEVTQELYEKIMGSNPSKFKGSNKPVENISWKDALEFCNLMSRKFGYEPFYGAKGKPNPKADGFRLPSQKEWLYAAQGNKKGKYAGCDDIEKVAWYKENSKNQTHDVATKIANNFGLYDMSGNVKEWCVEKNYFYNSSYDSYIYYVTSNNQYDHDPSVIGGAFDMNGYYCRTDEDWRYEFISDDRKYENIGFRIVRQIPN